MSDRTAPRRRPALVPTMTPEDYRDRFRAANARPITTPQKGR